jgi:hypothetical protein
MSPGNQEEPVGVVIGISDLGLAGHAGAAACQIISIGDLALRRRFGGQSVQVVIRLGSCNSPGEAGDPDRSFERGSDSRLDPCH